MGKGHKWVCEKIIKKFHAVSELEIEEKLAELWEILVPFSGQLNLSPRPIPVETSKPLSKYQKRTGR